MIDSKFMLTLLSARDCIFTDCTRKSKIECLILSTSRCTGLDLTFKRIRACRVQTQNFLEIRILIPSGYSQSVRINSNSI